VPIDPNYIAAFAQDAHGRIWVGTNGGVRIFEHELDLHCVNITTVHGLPDNQITALLADPQGEMWVGTTMGLVRWYNGVRELFTAPACLPDSNVTAIQIDHDANVWVGTLKGGISRLCRQSVDIVCGRRRANQ